MDFFLDLLEIEMVMRGGSTYPVSGTIVFQERRDGKITAAIQLNGTDGNVKHPVHLHLGNVHQVPMWPYC